MREKRSPIGCQPTPLPLREDVAIGDVQGPSQTGGFEIDRGLAVQSLRDDPLYDGAAETPRLRLPDQRPPPPALAPEIWGPGGPALPGRSVPGGVPRPGRFGGGPIFPGVRRLWPAGPR